MEFEIKSFLQCVKYAALPIKLRVTHSLQVCLWIKDEKYNQLILKMSRSAIHFYIASKAAV